MMMMEMMMIMKMEMMMMIRKLFLSTNYVPVIVLSTEDIKLNKGALLTSLLLTRTQYRYSFSKEGGVTSSYSHNWEVLVSQICQTPKLYFLK